MKICYYKNMKKFIVTILLVSAFCSGCISKNNQGVSVGDSTSTEVEQQTLFPEENQQENNIVENSNQQEIELKENDENLHPIDKAERDCIAKIYSTYDISQCSYKAMDSWFKEIDKYLGLLKTITSKEDYANILKAQEDWKKYQESEFVAISIIINKQGTMFQNVAAGKKTDIIKTRAIELKDLYGTLKYK